MLVYGDRWRDAAPEALIAAIGTTLDRAAGSAGLARQDLLSEALILGGELVQGVADAEFARFGVDDATPAQEASLEACVAVARSLVAGADPREAARRLALLRRLDLPATIRCKTPEGFAFYAVHPEGYARAAAAQDWGGAPVVIGLRSIGASLAAVVAAQTGGAVVTLRPCGHPFRRELRLSPTLRARLARHEGLFAVVDEGPGLSGSSFGAACDLLDGLGVAPDRIVLMPSHDGAPGLQASPRHRARWTAARRAPAARLVSAEAVAGWFAEATGPLVRVEDISGGGWRADLAAPDQPPAAPARERIKIRLTGTKGRHVARFAGLGRIGAEKLRVARLLHAAGFAPEPLALRRGFLLERWVEGRPLRAADLRRPGALAQAARYLGFRARALPATVGEGADWTELREMVRVNALELGGAALRDRLEARLDAAPLAPGALRPVRIDGRTQPWEWRQRPDGGLCKTDALDHAAAHDLIGCQDIAWDVAGASVEFALSAQEAEAFRAAAAVEAGGAIDRAWVEAFRLCYAAFQAGFWDMAAAEPGEGARARLERDRYVAVLRAA